MNDNLISFGEQLLRSKFPPFPPRSKWDFTACPEDERFTCLRYECNVLAQSQDPTFSDRLPQHWKYPQWPDTPYLEIPEKIRRQAQRELDPERLEEDKAHEVIPTVTIPPEAFNAFQSCIAIGEPPIYECDGKALALLEIHHGMAPRNLLEAVVAYIRRYHVPNALSSRPEGAGSYARDFQADLNALTAYLLLKTLSPAEATVVTGELRAPTGKKKRSQRRSKRGLYSNAQEWRSAAERGEFLIKKTLEGKLTDSLLSERFERLFTP
jgi:hypothetical protein